MNKSYVRSMFDGIAHRYDVLNHILSGGIDFYWRYKTMTLLQGSPVARILDVATGTADFAIAALRLNPQEIIGVDISEQMLAFGRTKLKKRGHSVKIKLETGEAEHLRFTDGYFDIAMVAFGARNFENLLQGLKEMNRVVCAGGKICVLEFSKPNTFPFRQLYFFYFKRILPLIGKLISQHQEAYQYLPETVMKFPEGQDFMNILSQSGFSQVQQFRVTFGIATIYIGVK